jgi:hypothetical protein
MPRTLILNPNNIVAGTGNSAFQYNFPLGGFVAKDEMIAVQQISLYQSVFNITTANNNNTFSYIWVDGSVHNIVIADGYYQLPEINAILQSYMVANLQYLTTTSGAYVYLLEIVVNQSRYAYQINSFLIDSTIVATNGWTPASTAWVPTTNAVCPIFVVPDTNFQQLIGFTAGKYPDAIITGATPATYLQTPTYTTTQSFLSQSAPQIIPQPSYLCLCSLVNNRLSIPSQLIYSLTPTGVTFGSLYTVQIADLVFNKIEDGQYPSLVFRFVDSLGNALVIQDPNILILLIIKSKSELGYI